MGFCIKRKVESRVYGETATGPSRGNDLNEVAGYINKRGKSHDHGTIMAVIIQPFAFG